MRARDRLTSATAELMQRRGVAGTGIAEILDASGVARRSIYLNFPGGKAELVAEATRAAGGHMAALVKDLMAQPDPIAAFTTMWGALLVESDFEGGCPILAAACGRDEAPDAARAAADVFGLWGQAIADRLMEDGIKTSVAQSLSVTVVAAFEGAVVLSRASRSTEPLDLVAKHMGELVGMHRPTGAVAK